MTEFVACICSRYWVGSCKQELDGGDGGFVDVAAAADDDDDDDDGDNRD